MEQRVGDDTGATESRLEADAETNTSAEAAFSAGILDQLRRREQALAKLLHNGDVDPCSQAVEALETALQPQFCAVAMLQEDAPATRIVSARCGGKSLIECDWGISPDRLRDMVAAENGSWSGSFPGWALPVFEQLDGLEEAELHSRSITCETDLAGFLVWIPGQAAMGPAIEFGDVGQLIALKLSADLTRLADRRALRLTEQQFRDVTETSFDWIWEMDTEHRITHVSDRWSEISGLSHDRFVGKTLTQLGIAENDPRWSSFYATIAAREPLTGESARILGADGRELFWKINGKPWYDDRGRYRGYRGTGTDVTAEVSERRRAEKAERILRDAIEALPQGFLVFDEDDRLLVCNERYKMFYPEIADELVPGAEFTDLVRIWAERAPERAEEMSVDGLINRRMNAHRADRREFEHVRPDGSSYLINELKTPSGCSVWLHTDISNLKRREQDLRKLGDELSAKNRQLDITINSMAEGLSMFGPDDRLHLVNRRWREMFDVPDELVAEGTPHADIVRWLEDNGVVDDLERVSAERWSQIRADGSAAYRRSLNDGRVLDVFGVAMDDGGILLTFHDVTLSARQAAALADQATQFEALSEALAQQNAYFDGALNAMVQGFATFSPDNRLMVCNKRFQKIFDLPDELTAKGATRDEIARFIGEIGLLDDAPAKIAATHDAAQASGAETVTMKLNDGRSFEVQNNILDNGDLLVAFHEITNMKDHAAKLDTYARRLEASNRELEEFAYVASHDLQEPLRKIEAFSDRLQKKHADRLDADAKQYVDRMLAASQRMRGLIDDLLDYSRVSTVERSFQPVDLRALIQDVAGDLEIAIDACAGEVLIDGELPEIEADPAQMRRLFQNLIANAIKFRRSDAAPAITVSAHCDGSTGRGDMCTISIADNGIGFEQRFAEQVFKIFHRLHGRTEYDGTGIGLATCRKIVDRHGGTISAASAPGAGTTITIVLPTVQPQISETAE